MPNLELLKNKISASGMTVMFVAKESGMNRATLYNRLNGMGYFKPDEIIGLTKTLRLTKAEREEIFLK